MKVALSQSSHGAKASTARGNTPIKSNVVNEQQNERLGLRVWARFLELSLQGPKSGLSTTSENFPAPILPTSTAALRAIAHPEGARQASAPGQQKTTWKQCPAHTFSRKFLGHVGAGVVDLFRLVTGLSLARRSCEATKPQFACILQLLSGQHQQPCGVFSRPAPFTAVSIRRTRATR